MNAWIKEKVIRGNQHGRTIGYPTINLNPKSIEQKIKQGVYACLVRYNNTEHKGVLFFGPRLVKNETHNVLEIYVLDFDKDVYDQEIEFRILTFIRQVKKFNSMEELKTAIEQDIAKAKNVLQ